MHKQQKNRRIFVRRIFDRFVDYQIFVGKPSHSGVVKPAAPS